MRTDNLFNILLISSLIWYVIDPNIELLITKIHLISIPIAFIYLNIDYFQNILKMEKNGFLNLIYKRKKK